MSCENCRNLKIQSFTFGELEEKWNELYEPEGITPGYRIKYLNESGRGRTALDSTKLTFMYCSRGILTRFYIIRQARGFGPKKDVGSCDYYN